MIVSDWDVWHVYSSFLDSRKIDLEEAAVALVQSGVAVCALHRDGLTWWHADRGVRSGITNIDLATRQSQAKIKLVVDGGGESGLTGYAAEAWYQASHFRFNELRVFGDTPRMPPPYVRAVLGELHLTSNETGFIAIIYPIIKLFENGVVLVEFRTMAPKREIDLDEFIDRFVNLAFVPFDEIAVPPAISVLATKAFYHSARSWPPHLRAVLAWLERSHETAVKDQTRETPSGDFVARLAPLAMGEGQVDTLSSLAKTLYSVIGFVLSKPRRGIAFVLRGQRHLTVPGGWWSGRPHVYLLDFVGQCASAQENVKSFGAELGWILGRHASGESEAGLRYLPKDQRFFEDFSVFVTQSASLLVWSKLGRERQEEWADANRGHLIYEHHAINEMLEYGHILHRALLAKTEDARDPSEIHSARWAVAQLRSEMADVSQFGEVRELLHAGWKSMGIDDIRSRIAEGLSIREAETSLREARSNERIRRSLTILFGIIATPSLASNVVNPIWKTLALWRPPDETVASLYFQLIALLSIVATIGLLSRTKTKVTRA